MTSAPARDELDRRVDDAGIQSFPVSDAPGWWAGGDDRRARSATAERRARDAARGSPPKVRDTVPPTMDSSPAMLAAPSGERRLGASTHGPVAGPSAPEE
jgi:hypothetical protein